MAALLLDIGDGATQSEGCARTGDAEASPRVSFASPELLWKALTPRRWTLLRALIGAGPVSIREAARRVRRDVKAVHGDVTALLDAGLLQRAGRGIVFPYDTIHVDFTITGRGMVDLQRYPELRLLAWQRRRDRWISEEDALALYEANWRFVDTGRLEPQETRLLQHLARHHGGGVLNV